MKRYILVQSITGIDLVARDIAKAAALPDDSDTMELPDGTVLSVGALRSHTMEWLKALCQKYHLCPVGSKTKEALITTMVLATKITARQVGDEVEAFIRDTKILICLPTLKKMYYLIQYLNTNSISICRTFLITISAALMLKYIPRISMEGCLKYMYFLVL